MFRLFELWAVTPRLTRRTQGSASCRDTVQQSQKGTHFLGGKLPETSRTRGAQIHHGVSFIKNSTSPLVSSKPRLYRERYAAKHPLRSILRSGGVIFRKRTTRHHPIPSPNSACNREQIVNPSATAHLPYIWGIKNAAGTVRPGRRELYSAKFVQRTAQHGGAHCSVQVAPCISENPTALNRVTQKIRRMR